MKQEESCAVCYKIRCRECGWEASDAEVLLVQERTLIACPVCGWKPGDNI